MAFVPDAQQIPLPWQPHCLNLLYNNRWLLLPSADGLTATSLGRVDDDCSRLSTLDVVSTAPRRQHCEVSHTYAGARSRISKFVTGISTACPCPSGRAGSTHPCPTAEQAYLNTVPQICSALLYNVSPEHRPLCTCLTPAVRATDVEGTMQSQNGCHVFVLEFKPPCVGGHTPKKTPSSCGWCCCTPHKKSATYAPLNPVSVTGTPPQQPAISEQTAFTHRIHRFATTHETTRNPAAHQLNH